MGSKKKGNGRKRQRTEWLEVGELWAELQHNLERPNWRMPNFAKFEETTERKKEARKLAHEEQKAMYMARRFDVDQECADMIYNWNEMNLDGNWMEQVSGFYNVVLELQMPFESMWIEFPDKEGHVIGCLAKDCGDKFTFQLFKDTQDDVLAHEYLLEISKEEYADWVDQDDLEGTGNITSAKIFGEACWGYNKYLLLLHTPDIGPVTRKENNQMRNWLSLSYLCSSPPLWHWKQKPVPPLFKKTDDPNMLMPIDGARLTDDHRLSLRFVVLLIFSLNYPWVQKEEPSLNQNQGKKSRRPNIKPHDSYYRCKITLPKPHGIETRSSEPREDAYGKRQHQVRGHYRIYRDENGDVKRRTWIREHRRGDPKLGVVLKDYVLTGDKDKKDDLED